jgi:nifR3 family TIM-barrel protein
MSYWNTPLVIGKLSVPRFLGGPLDGLTDAPFRAVTRSFAGAALLYTEIRHVAAVVKMPRALVVVDQATRPINFQMTAGCTDYIADACSIVLDQGVDAIDLNIGCPAPHVVGSGSGSALMGDIKRLETILKCFRSHVSCPFTVKMRAGFKEYNAEVIAQLCQDCGADALAVHPRLQKQKFKGAPDYRILAAVKKQVQIPVIVSGGINDFETAQAVYNQTGVDGFLVGRAQLGAPWLLYQMEEQAAGRSHGLGQSVMYDAIAKHMKLIERYYGNKGLPLAIRHLGFYMRGHECAGLIRRCAQASKDWASLHELVRNNIRDAYE